MWYKCAGIEFFLEKDVARFLTENGAQCEEMGHHAGFKPKEYSISMSQAMYWAGGKNPDPKTLYKFL